MKEAIKKEIEEKYVEAVVLYEKEINEQEIPDESTFINLSFIYWSFAFDEFGFNVPKNISSGWSLIGGEKYLKIINIGLSKYPNSLELNFLEQVLSI